MTASELEERFGIPGVLVFSTEPSGLVVVQVTSQGCSAKVYLQGAHLTAWQPAGEVPVIFLSERTELAPGKPIRGGVPVIFPWFGPRSDGGTGPAHGFARTREWEMAFAAVVGDEVHLAFTLAPDDASRALGFDHFRVAYRMVLGRRLTLELMVGNDADAGSGLGFEFEEALHTYFAVGDVEQVKLSGLGGTTYIDKRDGMKQKVQAAGTMSLTGTTDRVYLDTAATCTIEDTAGERRIVVEKSGSQTTVVWNPWAEVAATLPDMEPEGWRGMLCVETANVGESAVTLAPGESHAMRMVVSVETLEGRG